VKIKILENGPAIVETKGQVVVRMGAADESRSGPVALCRCGQSSTKPFCDGTHRDVVVQASAGELELGD
jgi:CDGSH-type Zn-finger protein